MKEVIWKHRLLVYGSFDYYATLYSTALDECNESDVHSLSFNGYLAMVRDAKFISKFCPARLLEIIFKAVNVDDDNVREKLGQNALARDEFNKMLVSIGTSLSRRLLGSLSFATSNPSVCLMSRMLSINAAR